MVTPVELIVMKVVSMAARPKTPKGLTDEVDLLRLLLTFPELKSRTGSVSDLLHQHNASDDALQIWQDLIVRDIRPENDDEYLCFVKARIAGWVVTQSAFFVPGIADAVAVPIAAF